MRVLKTLTFLILLAASLSLILLFTIQNMDQTVELGLNLGPVGAWRFAKPQPAVFVVLGAFAGGLVLVGLFAVLEIVLFERRIRRLNRLVAKLQGERGAADVGGA